MCNIKLSGNDKSRQDISYNSHFSHLLLHGRRTAYELILWPKTAENKSKIVVEVSGVVNHWDSNCDLYSTEKVSAPACPLESVTVFGVTFTVFNAAE